MKPCKVIGIGSPFGQDTLGWQAVTLLQTMCSEMPVEYIISDRPGLELLNHINGIEHVILVDAIDDEKQTGRIVTLTIDDLQARRHSLSSHAFGVGEALSLGHVLAILPRHIILFGICTDPNEPKPFDQEQIQVLCKQIYQYICDLQVSTGIPISTRSAILTTE
jgi:hydrogenase maturation protease